MLDKTTKEVENTIRELIREGKIIKEKQIKPTQPEKSEPEIIEEVKKKIEKETGKAWHYITEPKHIKVLKITAIIIVLGLVGFLIYNNFLVSKQFNYFYDIGSPQDAKKPYLSPAIRVSSIINETNVNYRNMTGHLVYFNVPITKGSNIVYIKSKIFDNFPNKSKMSIGASDNSTYWHYIYNIVYNQTNSDKNQWINVETEFNIKDKNLSIKKNQLSVLFNIPYLDQNKNSYINYTNNFIPIDYINITVYKPGMIERMREGEGFMEALKGVMK